MSIFKSILGGISSVLPVAAAFAPSSKRVTQALGTLTNVANAISSGNPLNVFQAARTATGAILSPAGVPMSIAAAGLPALPGRVAGVVSAGKALVQSPGFQRISKKAAAALNLAVLGGIAYDMATGQPVARVAGRRINPLNVRAARRAVRRIKSVRKICMNIERCLPKTKRCR